jgi:hypothetical protein
MPVQIGDAVTGQKVDYTISAAVTKPFNYSYHPRKSYCSTHQTRCNTHKLIHLTNGNCRSSVAVIFNAFPNREAWLQVRASTPYCTYSY